MVGTRSLILTCLLFLVPLMAKAVEPDEIMPDPKLEARARALSAELRCMVCQNESIDESHADLARDLRLLVRERLQAGDSDDQIRAFLVRRYGDFILLKPPFKLETWLLWGPRSSCFLRAPALSLLPGGGNRVSPLRTSYPKPNARSSTQCSATMDREDVFINGH